MRKLNKMRIGLSAIALGLLMVGGLANVATVMTPAVAQGAKASSQEFLDAYKAAKGLVDSKKYSEALPKIDAAASLAKGNSEKSAVQGMKVLTYAGLRRNPELIKAIQDHQAMGVQSKNYTQMLAGAYAATGQSGKAMELTKQLIAEGGGSCEQLAYVAKGSLGAKRYDEAISFANKAIEQCRKDGKKPQQAHYNILLAAYRDTGKMDQYYSTLERVAPIFNSQDYWKPLIERAKSEPKFKSADGLLDVYRALETTNVKLSDTDKLEMGEQALVRGMPIEADRILTPLFKGGTVGGPKDPKADRNKKLYGTAQADAKAAKAGGLEKAEADAAAKQTGDFYAKAGEAYYTAGNHAKAVEVIQKGIAKGQMEPGALAFAQLHLGIAQYKAGQKDAARKTWSEIKADNGAGWLARTWTAISKSGA